MKVHIELFQVAMDGFEACYRKTVVDATGSDRDPDEVVAGYLACPDGEPGDPVLVHSTSWRYAPDGSLVLTYLALVGCAARLGESSQRADLRAVELPASRGPRCPRPAEIREEHVLAHGLRHLAFLEQAQGTVGTYLGARAANHFADLAPAPAGRLA